LFYRIASWSFTLNSFFTLPTFVLINFSSREREGEREGERESERERGREKGRG